MGRRVKGIRWNAGNVLWMWVRRLGLNEDMDEMKGGGKGYMRQHGGRAGRKEDGKEE